MLFIYTTVSFCNNSSLTLFSIISRCYFKSHKVNLILDQSYQRHSDNGSERLYISWKSTFLFLFYRVKYPDCPESGHVLKTGFPVGGSSLLIWMHLHVESKYNNEKLNYQIFWKLWKDKYSALSNSHLSFYWLRSFGIWSFQLLFTLQTGFSNISEYIWVLVISIL